MKQQCGKHYKSHWCVILLCDFSLSPNVPKHLSLHYSDAEQRHTQSCSLFYSVSVVAKLNCLLLVVIALLLSALLSFTPTHIFRFFVFGDWCVCMQPASVCVGLTSVFFLFQM